MLLTDKAKIQYNTNQISKLSDIFVITILSVCQLLPCPFVLMSSRPFVENDLTCGPEETVVFGRGGKRCVKKFLPRLECDSNAEDQAAECAKQCKKKGNYGGKVNLYIKINRDTSFQLLIW